MVSKQTNIFLNCYIEFPGGVLAKNQIVRNCGVLVGHWWRSQCEGGYKSQERGLRWS